MTQPLPNFKEEFSAKIPALTLLTNLGYQFISPDQCASMRGSTELQQQRQVILVSVMRDFLAKQLFPFAGNQHNLSIASVDKIIQELSPALNEGLQGANEKLYNAMMYGISVTEFINGKKATPTIQLIDWQNINNNSFHFTEEMIIENSQATGIRIPDIVCFVNGLPLVVIEAKRPDSSIEGKSTLLSGVSQHIRNQGQTEIPHLFAYSQLLLSINGHDGLYATCGTPEKFWANWKEELIPEAEYVRLKNQPLTETQFAAIFDHRPAEAKQDYLSMIAAGDLSVTNQDRLLVSLLRPDRLLEITRLFTLFDKKSGKFVARYQQFFGIKAIIERVTGFDDQGARNGGVIWHTTGSGKSFTIVFLSKSLI